MEIELITLSAAAAVFLLLLVLLRRRGSGDDQKNRRLGAVKGQLREETKEKKSLLRAYKESLKRKQQQKLRGQELQSSRSQKKLSLPEQMLQMAGIPLTGMQFTMIKLASALLLGFLGYKVAGLLELDPLIEMFLPLGGLLLGMLLPGRWLTNQVARRKALYRDSLPDLMDLLVVSVEAGLGFDAALLRLYEKDKSPLMQEMMRTVQDVQHGMTKREAYRNMSERCGVKEIRSFLNALVQAEQMGISVKTVLKTQAETLREERRQRAEEKALKAPVTMLVPMVIFIFPVIFIVLLGPALMNVMEVL